MYTLGGTLGETAVEPGTNVLVTGPPLTGKRRIAREVLERGVEDGEAGVAITTRDSADRIRSLLDVTPGEDRIGIVDCITAHAGRDPGETEAVKYAASPTDMTDVGIKFAELIEHFHCERGIQRNRVVVDSITTLLEYGSLQTAFRFLHATTRRTAEIDGIGVHVVDSTVHDVETMRTVRELFDGEIETDVGGDVGVDLPADVTARLAES